MHAFGGVHPLVMRRHRLAVMRRKTSGHGELLPSVGLVMLFLISFACGLRWIDHRYAAPAATETPAPYQETEGVASINFA